MKSIFEQTALQLIEELSKHDIKAYIWHIATTGSVYIRFNDPRYCSVRIGDHEGRNKLKYKYNLRSDKVKYGWVKDNDVWRYFTSIDNWKDLIPILIDRREKLKNYIGGNKYEYNIPHFKK